MVTESPLEWLLLVYRIPREPSAGRVAVWRKLQRLGAILLHDSVWVLPPTPRTSEELQWLAAEIRERGGEALLWESRAACAGLDETLVAQFLGQTDAVYAEILEALGEPVAGVLEEARFEVAERVGGIGAVVAEGGVDGMAVAHLANAVARQGISLRAVEGVGHRGAPQ